MREFLIKVVLILQVLIGGGKMYAFNEHTKVKLIYISCENLSKQKIIYEGDVTGFRNNLSIKNFQGFEKNQHFTLIDENVKILKKIKHIDSESIISNVIYYAGPDYLNPEKSFFNIWIINKMKHFNSLLNKVCII